MRAESMSDRAEAEVPHSPTPHRAPILFGASLLVVYAIFCQRITPFVAISGPLRLDIVLLALCGAATLFRTVGSLDGFPGRWRMWARIAVGGALLGAAMVAPWVAVPWLVVSGLAFAWAGRNRGGSQGRRAAAFAVFMLAATVNLATVSVLNARGLRASPDDFAARDFYVNTLLADLPLHDVFAIDLIGRDTATMDEVAAAFRGFSPWQTTPAMLGLGVLRGLMGFAFGWEDPRWVDEEASFVHRLSETDHDRSTMETGTSLGIWTFVYAFPEEGMVETINGTVHVAVTCAIGEGAAGPRLFLAFHVKEVNWTTPFYMGLINPFRRYFYYPPLIRQFAHTWETG